MRNLGETWRTIGFSMEETPDLFVKLPDG